MEYVISNHAKAQMQERDISEEEVDSVLQNPQQIVDGERGRKVYQSLTVKNSRLLLLRVIVVPNRKPPVVVSVYVTTQGRYWSSL